MKIKCSRCNYEWDTKSNLVYVTCPSCRTKIKNRRRTQIISYLKKRDDEAEIKKRRAYSKEWYRKNKEKQNKNVLKNYHKNKIQWNSRSITGRIVNSEKYKHLFNKKCIKCGSKNNIEINHDIYPSKTKEILKAFKDKKIYFMCRDCHREYHRKNPTNFWEKFPKDKYDGMNHYKEARLKEEKE